MPKRKREASPEKKTEHESEGWAQFSKTTKKATKPAQKASSTVNAKADGPFPDHNRPSETEARAARDSLALLHGEPERPAASGGGKAQNTIIDSLVRTILSQNTTDSNSHKTFANLKSDFEDWEAVRTAKTSDVEAAIKFGGLAATKSVRIQEILNTVKAEKGQCSLEHLRDCPDEEIKSELSRYPGVGPKTVACVLMFCLGRYEFPVDTHVWRITKSLRWVPEKANREQTYEHLNLRIPADIKYDLHVLLVEHGKRCPRCAKNHRPRKEVHGPCPLTNLSVAAEKGESLSASKAAEDAQEALKLEAADIRVKEEDSSVGKNTADVKDEKVDVKTEPELGSTQEEAVKGTGKGKRRNLKKSKSAGKA